MGFMDPAIFIEAQQAQLHQRAAEARELVVRAARRLAQQHEIVKELESDGRSTTVERRALSALAAMQRLHTGSYERLLQHLHNALAPQADELCER